MALGTFVIDPRICLFNGEKVSKKKCSCNARDEHVRAQGQGLTARQQERSRRTQFLLERLAQFDPEIIDRFKIPTAEVRLGH